MFTPEQVKPFITHADPLVSNAAIRFLAETYKYPQDISALVLEKLVAAPRKEDVYLHRAAAFPQTKVTVQAMLHLLKADLVTGNARIFLSRMLLGSSPDLLKSHLPAIRELDEDWYDEAAERVRVSELTDEWVRRMFNEETQKNSGLDYGDIDYDTLDLLLGEMIEREMLQPRETMDELQEQYTKDPESVRTVYLMQAAGKLKIAYALPLFYDALKSDNDLVAEQAADALVRVGSEEVVEKLVQMYAEEKDGFLLLGIVDILSRILLPSAEEALIALLEKEDHFTRIAKLADGLCRLGSEQALPVVQELVKIGYDKDYVELKESVYACCVIMGRPLPELDEWRREIAAEDEERAKKLQG
ncbi:HEAT repeat domain-containing protein [Saccharibacillus deserti]|uniref:HEAT repeat domain-containing protein n=1 Tax=Saccharibacillus deserti TaxID=1634444 RepID=UPI0015558822|nr:HEAT repeat domain-containing protein [Saccharibacillus deserti]